MLLLQSHSDVRLINPATGDMSVIELFPKSNLVSLVNPATAEMSVIELSSSHRNSSWDNPDKAEMSDILLPFSVRWVKLVANSSPVKSLMFAFLASRRVKVAISDGVIGSPFALPRSLSTAARRLESGMFTAVSAAALKVIVPSIPAADTETVFVPRFGPSVSVLSALPLFISRGTHDTEHSIACGDGKRDRNPFKPCKLLIPYFNDKRVYQDRTGYACLVIA